MASTYLTSGNLSSAGNQKKWTISFWVKRAKLGVTQGILDYSVNSTNYYNFTFKSTDGLTMFNNDGGTVSYELEPSMKFRDTSGWYHIVHQYDSEQATESNRAKLWVNGVQQSSWTNENYPSQGANTKIPNSGYPINIGRQYRANTNVQYFDGSLSHFHFCDGYAYSASDFGQTDANGVWKIKTSPSVTYGNNGFFILKDGNSVTDQSGNSNNFTVAGGTLTNTEDSPSNVFATFNPLWSLDNEGSYSNGNTTWSSSSSNAWYQGMGTLAFSSGKYYWEVKVTGSTNVDKSTIGICGVDAGVQTGQLQDKTPSVFFKNEDGGEMRVNAVTGTDDYGTFAQNDIMGIAVDMDSLTMSLYKNGTILVNAHDISGIGSGSVMTPATMHYNQNTHQYNFGNGYFGTTPVASAGTNASGNGIFEYDVPTGYTALSTKGLNL